MCENVLAYYKASKWIESSKTHRYTIHHKPCKRGIGATTRFSKEILQTLKAMWDDPRWKSILHFQMRNISSQGWNWPLWLLNFPHDCLTYMNLQPYMTLQLYMWVSWTSTLHYIDYNSMAHNSDEVEMTHDMTQHESASMFMFLVVSMLSFSATKWWMFSWCIIASSPHDKVWKVFDGLGVHLIISHACSSFACTLTCFMCPSVHEKISLHAFLVFPFAQKPPCMHSLFVHSQINLLACIPHLSVREQISLHEFLICHSWTNTLTFSPC